MTLDDPLLPAARHLLGVDAIDLLRTAVAAHGGDLHGAELVQAQHRPGHDLVARYDVTIAWAGRPAGRETLLAAATTSGAPSGTLSLVADDLEAGVWRYPFDPRLPGLADAVTPGRVDRILDGVLPPGADLEVVAYRPIRRAVVRASAGGRQAYLKVVRPEEVAAIVARHTALHDAGLPVPEVLGTDEDRGLLVLEGLEGQNLRNRLLDSTDGWPPPTAHLELMARLAMVTLPPEALPVDGAMTTVEVAEGHARGLAAILPGEAERLAQVTAVVGALPADTTPQQTVHGDLYEAQLMVSAGRLVGLLDLDDVRPGHPLEDPATLLAHLHILEPATRRHRDHLRRHRQNLRTAFARALSRDGDPTELDLRTAAVLIGLATGPFRAQRDRWQAEVRARIAIAAHLVDEKNLRRAS